VRRGFLLARLRATGSIVLTALLSAIAVVVPYDAPPTQLLWPAAIPNDPDYHKSQAAYLQTVNLPAAWDETTGSEDAVVAVLDSGIDAQHPDLAGRLVAGRNVVARNDDTADRGGHGTTMAGILGAVTNNGLGIAGVAWAAKIMPVKVTKPSGVATDGDVAAGIVWAADHGADVISISLSAPIKNNDVMQDAVDYATARDVLVVAAAGNHGSDVPEYPGASRGVVAVGATDASGHRTAFSNFGRWVDVNAPGVGLVTTKPGSRDFTTVSGTSAATALVAGVAVLLRTAHPRAGQADIADRLRRSAFGRGPVGAEGIDASGVIDAAGALRLPARSSPSGPARSGYLIVGTQGNVDAFGDTSHCGDAWGDLGRARVTHLQAASSGTGYWMLDDEGRVKAFGGARHYGQLEAAQRAPSEEAVALSAIPGDAGYRIFTDRGRVFSFGRAQNFGDLAELRLNRPIVAAVGTSSGGGYLMVADDGGVFTFGDARFAGSMGGRQLNAPIRSIALDRGAPGYWLGAADGGVFAFEARYRGSLGSTRLNAPIVGMAACGGGYLLVASDGGVFNFSDCPFYGSLADGPPPRHIAGLASLGR
ncbi:MAG TPA: S8 family serine peptidase, partial [Acidimicrobiia bacterium]|nr:S8 family serine peptidase [Acidimicrobiia bacterium]